MQPASLARTVHRVHGFACRKAAARRAACRRLLIFSAALLAAGGLPLDAAEAHGSWVSEPQLAERLEAPVSLAWSDVPLRRALQNFTHAQGLGLLIDRRIDPDRPIDLSLRGLPLRAALERIAAARGMGVSLLESVVYFGPRSATDRLATLAALRRDEAHRLPPSGARRFAARRSCQWEPLAVPRQIVSQLAAEAGLAVRSLDRMPHDLWPAATLPPLSLTDRLTLVANGFDLTFRIVDQRTIELVPIEGPVVIERTYTSARAPQQKWREAAARLPAVELRFAQDEVIVRGPLEAHRRLLAELRPAAPRPQDAGRPRPLRGSPPSQVHYSLTVRNKPVGHVIEELGRKLHFEVQLETGDRRPSPAVLGQLVSFQVRDATLDQLLEATLEPAGLRFQRDGKRVTVGVEAAP